MVGLLSKLLSSSGKVMTMFGDPDWQEVYFVGSWAREKRDETKETD